MPETSQWKIKIVSWAQRCACPKDQLSTTICFIFLYKSLYGVSFVQESALCNLICQSVCISRALKKKSPNSWIYHPSIHSENEYLFYAQHVSRTILVPDDRAMCKTDMVPAFLEFKIQVEYTNK